MTSQIMAIQTSQPVISTGNNGPGRFRRRCNHGLSGCIRSDRLDQGRRRIHQLHRIRPSDGGGGQDYHRRLLRCAVGDGTIIDERDGRDGPPCHTGLNLVTTQYQVDNQGRTIEMTDPNGNETFSPVYNDAAHEVPDLSRLGFDPTKMTTGAIMVTRDDPSHGYEANALL